MGSDPPVLAAARLKKRFQEVVEAGTLGGSTILTELAATAIECCAIADDGKAVVAVALSALLGIYADNRYQTAVTGQDFPDNCLPVLSEAVAFISSSEKGEAIKAIGLAATLARNMPYQH